MVLAGGEDGSLTVWDLRHHTFPVTLLSAHSDTGTAAIKMKSCHIKNLVIILHTTSAMRIMKQNLFTEI
jgi:hypothetical protein